MIKSPIVVKYITTIRYFYVQSDFAPLSLFLCVSSGTFLHIMQKSFNGIFQLFSCSYNISYPVAYTRVEANWTNAHIVTRSPKGKWRHTHNICIWWPFGRLLSAMINGLPTIHTISFLWHQNNTTTLWDVLYVAERLHLLNGKCLRYPYSNLRFAIKRCWR